MQNYPIGYQQIPSAQTQCQTQTMNATPCASTNGATFNIGNNIPGAIPVNASNGASGVTINIMGASVNPNGANINNTYNTCGLPGQAYDKTYYTSQPGTSAGSNGTPSVSVAASSLSKSKETEEKNKAKKEIVLLTDEYIKTLENYIRNDNPDIKLMGAKELMKRFREDKSRKNDPALTALLNLTLQSKYSNVKMVGMGILQNGWAQGDAMTQQLLAQIQQDNKSGYGLDAIDAAQAALKTAGQTVEVDDPNPPKEKTKKKAEKFDRSKYE